jgi:hypothetical protein
VKLVRYADKGGNSLGIVKNGGIIDLRKHWPVLRDDMIALMEMWPNIASTLPRLAVSWPPICHLPMSACSRQ